MDPSSLRGQLQVSYLVSEGIDHLIEVPSEVPPDLSELLRESSDLKGARVHLHHVAPSSTV
jgi:hypothetical protein